jgi:hypothetical protein
MMVLLIFPYVRYVGLYKSDIISRVMKVFGQEVNINDTIFKTCYRNKIVTIHSMLTVKRQF